MRQLDSDTRSEIRDLARQWVTLVNIRHQMDEDKLISGTLGDATREMGGMIDRVWANYATACSEAGVCHDIACWDVPERGRNHCAEHGRRRSGPREEWPG